MFGNRADSMARTPSGSRPATAATFSMLGADTVITGNIAATADLHIDGRVDGDIACHALVQGEDSEITGAIRAEAVRVAGFVQGMIVAREVVILRSARVAGDVCYDTLTIEQGARLDGRLNPNGGQVPPALCDLTGSHEDELLLTQEQ